MQLAYVHFWKRINNVFLPPVCDEDLLLCLLQCISNILHIGFTINIPEQLMQEACFKPLDVTVQDLNMTGY